jgi:hypothetical protein
MTAASWARVGARASMSGQIGASRIPVIIVSGRPMDRMNSAMASP